MTLDTGGEELVDAIEVAERLGLKGPRTVLDLRFAPPRLSLAGREVRSSSDVVVASGRDLGRRFRSGEL